MKIDVLDKGFVELVDFMGSDLSVVNAARVSFGKQKSEMSDGDKKLIKYLAEHKHMSPFRHVQLQFRIKAPEFVMRQWYKHVVGITYSERCVDHAWNEISGRYVEYEPEYYTPKVWRSQSKDNKQCSTDEPAKFQQNEMYASILMDVDAFYHGMIHDGVAKEQARIILPLSMYTEVIWTASLEAIANFIKLRDHEGAQWEIREYAKAVKELVTPICPIAIEALLGKNE